ncbi:BTB/POZ protein [Phyllosticta citribraziliensis]|uniref:BTB/POZ protein n=1 Tax=Phyllosticta citribraziliensis TaxID=989973 RepID=A0ABR1LPQ7_9PEZI
MASDPPGDSPKYPCERIAYCFRTYERMVAQEDAPRASRLHMQFNLLFSSSEYSDLTIRTRDGGELKVHKAIVCTTCAFFKNALKNGFKESKTGLIEMPNDPPHAVRALVQYCYHHEYPMSKDIFIHVEVHIAATTYMLAGLKRLAWARFIAELRSRNHNGGDISKLVTLV